MTTRGLTVRVGPEAMDDALARPHVRRLEFGGRSAQAFVVVAPDGYQDDAALAEWVERGIRFVDTLEQPTQVGRTLGRDLPATRVRVAAVAIARNRLGGGSRRVDPAVRCPRWGGWARHMPDRWRGVLWLDEFADRRGDHPPSIVEQADETG